MNAWEQFQYQQALNEQQVRRCSQQTGQDFVNNLVAENHRRNIQAVEYGAAGYGLGMLVGRWIDNFRAGRRAARSE